MHGIGRRSLKAHPGRHAGADAANEARDFRITPYLLRKARVFADPKRGCTAKELNNLCKSIRSCWHAFADNGASFGRTHVLRLVSVPKSGRRRASIQEAMFENGWSTAELESEIFRRYGRRGQGGRKGEIGTKVGGILVRLDRLCTGWLRFHGQLAAREGNNDGPAFAELPATVHTLVKSITSKMRRLSNALDANKRVGQ
ncbi:MAG: hypothetical protein U0791_13640 [Gemmataceae bacterium]